MKVVNIRLLNSRNSSKVNNRFIESEQISRRRKRNVQFNHNLIPELPLKLDKTNSLLFSPVVSYVQNHSPYFNKNNQYGIFQISSNKIALANTKIKNVFLTSIYNRSQIKSNTREEKLNSNSNSNLKLKLKETFSESNNFRMPSSNKINKINKINKTKKHINLYYRHLKNKLNFLVRPKNTTQMQILENKNQNIKDANQNHNQNLNRNDSNSKIRMHTLNKKLSSTSTQFKFNNVYPNLNKCLVEYEKQNQNLSTKHLIANRVAKERLEILEQVEKREFREEFFKTHLLHDLPPNIESFSIDKNEKIQRESTRLMNNIKRINARIYSENEDILCYCNTINNAK